jgi:hypothetical protein
VVEEPDPPQGNGVPAAPEFGGDGPVGWVIVLGQAEDDSRAESESLWGGRRPGESAELAAAVGGQTHDRGMGDGHGGILTEAGAIWGSHQFDRCDLEFQTNCPGTSETVI